MQGMLFMGGIIYNGLLKEARDICDDGVTLKEFVTDTNYVYLKQFPRYSLLNSERG